MSSKRKGRPPVFTGKVKKHIVGLIRKHGLTGTRRILAADVNATADQCDGAPADCRAAAEEERALAAERIQNLVPGPMSISMPTLGKFADEAGIEVPMGRPSTVAG